MGGFVYTDPSLFYSHLSLLSIIFTSLITTPGFRSVLSANIYVQVPIQESVQLVAAKAPLNRPQKAEVATADSCKALVSHRYVAGLVKWTRKTGEDCK